MQPTGTTADAGSLFNAARPKSAASWGAIIAGALVAIAVSLILFALGSGLGFASLSPWEGRGIQASTFTIAAAIWFIVMQWVSSLFGGYIAGRLRTRWIGTHHHEIFFRDTAHGFVTWALATVIVAAIVATTAASGVSGGVHALEGMGAEAGARDAMAPRPRDGAGEPHGMAPGGPVLSYGVDKLFRAGISPSDVHESGDSRAEASGILLNALATGSMPASDRGYLTRLVAARTGLAEADAKQRVDEFIANAMDAQTKTKAAVDTARKGAAEASIYTALAMLIGAFIASVAAALGGRLRDEHV